MILNFIRVCGNCKEIVKRDGRHNAAMQDAAHSADFKLVFPTRFKIRITRSDVEIPGV